MSKPVRFLLVILVLGSFIFSNPANAEEKAGSFQRRWNLTSENSAIIYWQLDDISRGAISFVEYGTSKQPNQKTQTTKKARWTHLHRLTGLNPGETCYYRMVMINPDNGSRIQSELLELKPARIEQAIRIPQDLQGNPPWLLDKDNAYYLLTENILAKGSAFILKGSKTTLDLNGYEVVFGNDTDEQVYGVRIESRDSCRIINGKIIQGARSYDYSAAIASLERSFERPAATEIAGISTDVHLPNTWPMNFTHAEQLEVHHCDIYSRVTEVECRHYPGNALLRIYSYGGDISVHDNLLTEGCHWGIVVKALSPTIKNVEVNHNDILHHQQYVNGYALSPGSGAKVHHNKITSSGRGVHLTGEGTEFYENYIDTQGHQQLSDLPARSRPFHHRLIELHGIKFEGRNTKNCKIYNNFVRITQHQPIDSQGTGEPDNKMKNGVYFRSTASSIEEGKLVDKSKKWEKDRWRFYYVKTNPNQPPVQITGNDENILYGNFKAEDPSDYTLYMVWNYVPPTPLNIACYDPNGMNEIYNNTFIGITTYKNTRHGDYGDSGEWATAVMFVGMNKGPADPGNYSAFIHDNKFYSNDLFLNSYTNINMDIKLERNAFYILKEPFTTERDNRIRSVGAPFEKQVRETNKWFE